MNIGFICFSYIGYLKLSYPQTYLECDLYENSTESPRSKTDPIDNSTATAQVLLYG
jgi:hypothetical protein